MDRGRRRGGACHDQEPDEYYAVLAELNRDGRLLSVDDYLAANPGQVDAAVRNYRYHIGMPPR